MAFTLSVSDVIALAARQRSIENKIKVLKEHNSQALRTMFAILYDPDKYVWNLPTDEAPPYTPSPLDGNFGVLYNEIRYLKYFFKGFGGDNLTAIKRESIFIRLLEDVHKKDAEMLVSALLSQKPVKGLTAEVINEALGMDLPIPPKKKTTKEP